MLAEPPRPLTQRRLRSPRAAAVAGIAFSILIGAALVLIQLFIPPTPIDDGKWLLEKFDTVVLAANLVPFAGIAFLWFIAVIRDQLGELEDQFFSTIFFGSGLLFLGGLFVWMGALTSILASFAANPDTWIGSDAYHFGRTLMDGMGGVVALRMAGVFMFSLGTIWSRTIAMPRWLIWLTYLMALGLIIGGGLHRALRLSFPVWVLIVSLLILWRELRKIDDEESGG